MAKSEDKKKEKDVVGPSPPVGVTVRKTPLPPFSEVDWEDVHTFEMTEDHKGIIVNRGLSDEAFLRVKAMRALLNRNKTTMTLVRSSRERKEIVSTTI